jgi:uncharacterized protein (TIGR03083 family)
MTTTSTNPTDAQSIPRIEHDEAMPIAAREYQCFLDLLQELDGDDWARQTDNDEWDVRATALHVLGASASNASMREMAHQMRHGRKLFSEIGSERHWHHWVDGVNEVQVRERADLSNDALVRAFADIAPKAVRGRTKLPRPLRALRVVDLPPPYTRRMPLGWLTDVVYTRDTWMHRVDIAHATGRPVAVTAEHDGRLIADMVAEWAGLYDTAFDVELTGPAGGRYRRGTGGEHVVVDAVEFVRILSGRAPGAGVLANSMPL